MTVRHILEGKWFFYAFVLLGCILQLMVYEEGMMLSLISGLCGVFSLVLVSRRKMSQFLFGFVQLITYFIISWRERLWGEVAITVFFTVMMVFALFTWSKNYDGKVVESRHLSRRMNVIICVITAIMIGVVSQLLALTTDSQPFMDSFTTVPAITAQTLMVLRYREQWFYWIVIDLGAIVMWAIAGDFNMTAQYVFWTLNCIYGWILWKD